MVKIKTPFRSKLFILITCLILATGCTAVKPELLPTSIPLVKTRVSTLRPNRSPNARSTLLPTSMADTSMEPAMPTLTLPALKTAVITTLPSVSNSTPPPERPTQISADNPLEVFCAIHPPIAPNDNWVEMIDALKLQTDLSPAAQSQLSQPVVYRPTCNFYKENNPRALILHYTAGSLVGAVATFQLPHNTSAHYVIGRDGAVVQLVPEGLGAYHVTCYGYRSYCLPSCPICDLNGKFVEPATQSIGIEMVNEGHVDPATFHGSIYEDYQDAFGYRFWEDYPPAQIAALKVLVADIRARWGIPWQMVMGHSRIDPKDDPGPALNLFWPRDGNPPRPPIFDLNSP